MLLYVRCCMCAVVCAVHMCCSSMRHVLCAVHMCCSSMRHVLCTRVQMKERTESMNKLESQVRSNIAAILLERSQYSKVPCTLAAHTRSHTLSHAHSRSRSRSRSHESMITRPRACDNGHSGRTSNTTIPLAHCPPTSRARSPSRTHIVSLVVARGRPRA